MPTPATDFLIIGSGAVGITLALEARQRSSSALGGFRWDEFLEVGRRELPKGVEARPGAAGRGAHRRARLAAGKPGIRTQLVNVRERRLEMDFRYEGGRRSFHVLNPVPPAFTCALPFAAYAFDQIDQRLHGVTGAGAALALQTTAQP